MKESIDSIIEWHKTTFPDENLDGQLLKYQEEELECRQSDYKDISEFADLYIVACGISRFDLNYGASHLMHTYNLYMSRYRGTREELEEAIDKKMAKNRSRTWVKMENGSYHHTNKEN